MEEPAPEPARPAKRSRNSFRVLADLSICVDFTGPLAAGKLDSRKDQAQVAQHPIQTTSRTLLRRARPTLRPSVLAVRRSKQKVVKPQRRSRRRQAGGDIE